MNRWILILAILLLLTSSGKGQVLDSAGQVKDDSQAQQLIIFSELQSLETRASRLDQPLARAAAKAEIADAAWTLDKTWAQKLLTEAYELTFPSEEEQIKLRSRPAGSAPLPPTTLDRARGEIRNRVLSIANRDKNFAAQVLQSGAKRLGKYEEHLRDAVLAHQAIKAGRVDEAVRYIIEAIEADPTQITIIPSIQAIAAQDRTVADELIIQYLERLRRFPLSVDKSFGRVYIILQQLIFPAPLTDLNGRPVAQPGPQVMRAYVGYVIESLDVLEQSHPGFLRSIRSILMTAWLPLQQYAPEMAGDFLELEKFSRTPGQEATFPKLTAEQARRNNYEKQKQQELERGQPDESIINDAINREDFNTARKLIAKLTDEELQIKLLEIVNLQEAMKLARKGELTEADRLAQRLNNATSILQAYPLIIDQCVESKNESYASVLLQQAIRQLKRANAELSQPPQASLRYRLQLTGTLILFS
ncbi:MAG: hypothetical protein JOZ52_08940 [Acidobacteria bacterium]|nr:hypothetical protein [Acidobacteriota bacterium]